MKKLSVFRLVSFLAFTLAFSPATAETVYIVNDYRYISANATDDQETGHSLCGTRCNAISADYLSITAIEGWRLIELAKSQELVVELNSPFLTGRCVCIGDTYLAKNIAANSQRPRTQEEQAGNNDGRTIKSSSRRWYTPAH